MGDDAIERLHAELERLAAEVAALRERLDDRDMEQAARDDALNRAMTGGRRPWSPRLLDGGAVHQAAMVALTMVTGAPTVCEHLVGERYSSTETRRFGYRPICSCRSSGSMAVR